jgi:hypothetical protein
MAALNEFTVLSINLMSKMVSEGQRDWQDCLPHVVAAYNAAQHETTNFSPFYLMYGREYRTSLDLVLNVEMENETSTGLDYTDQLRERYRQAFASVNSRMKTQTQRMKQRYDARVKERSFTEGDYVWYYVPRRKQGRNQEWRRLCDIFRVNRRFNDVLCLPVFAVYAISLPECRISIIRSLTVVVVGL